MTRKLSATRITSVVVGVAGVRNEGDKLKGCGIREERSPFFGCAEFYGLVRYQVQQMARVNQFDQSQWPKEHLLSVR